MLYDDLDERDGGRVEVGGSSKREEIYTYSYD